MKRKIGMFPVDRDSIPVARSITECRYGEITTAVSVKSWGMCGKFIDRMDGSKLLIEDDFGKLLEKCDVLLLLESYFQIPYEDLFLYIERALEYGLEVISVREFGEKKQELENLGVQFIERIVPVEDCSERRVKTPHIPIISVMGLTQNSGKLAMQLEVQHELQRRGYRAAVLLSHANGLAASDAFAFPEDYLTGKVDYEEAIININYAIDKISEMDYEAIIVGIPGACLQFSPKYSNDFGITSQLYLSAMDPDCTILMLPYYAYENDFIDHVKQDIQSRYDVDVYKVGVSNYTMDMDVIAERKKMSFLDVSCQRELFESLDIKNTFYIYSKQQVEKVVEGIIDFLSAV